LAFAAHYLQSNDQPFVVMNADILTNLNLGKLYDYHLAHQPLATLAVTERESSRQFLFDDQMKLFGWRNNKTDELKLVDPSYNHQSLQPFAFSGIHVIHPRIFKLMPASGNFSITNTYLDLASAESIMGFNHTGDVVLDVGKPEAAITAGQLFP
jgi:NDP-sugar pyrophosphorylase family protein